jgi:hypothetical protein
MATAAMAAAAVAMNRRLDISVTAALHLLLFKLSH